MSLGPGFCLPHSPCCNHVDSPLFCRHFGHAPASALLAAPSTQNAFLVRHPVAHSLNSFSSFFKCSLSVRLSLPTLFKITTPQYSKIHNFLIFFLQLCLLKSVKNLLCINYINYDCINCDMYNYVHVHNYKYVHIHNYKYTCNLLCILYIVMYNFVLQLY